MENKDIAKGALIAGVLLWCAPILLKNFWGVILRYLGFVVMGLGVVVLVAGDKAIAIISNLGKSGGSKLNYERMFKKGEITAEQYKEFKTQEIRLEKEKVQAEIMKLKVQQEIEKEKAELRRLKTLNRPQGAQAGTKMPDVLGNLGDFVRTDNKSAPDTLKNLNGMMGNSKPNDEGLRQAIGAKRMKDPLDNLQDLFK